MEANDKVVVNLATGLEGPQAWRATAAQRSPRWRNKGLYAFMRRVIATEDRLDELDVGEGVQ